MSAPHEHAEVCRNCGAPLHGLYCSDCGQSEHEGQPPTVKHFLHELLHELEHVDGKIVRSVWLLLFKPGRLTAEYWAGRVVSFVRPIRLFLIAAALQLLISAGVGPLNFQVYVERSAAGELNVNIGPDTHGTGGKLIGAPVPETERLDFAEKFNHAYLTIRYSSVLIFAGLSWLLWRKQQPFIVNHLIAGLHFYAFWYLLGALVSLPGRLSPYWNQASFLTAVYLFLTLGVLYRDGWALRLAKTVLLFGVLVITDLGLGFAAAIWVEKVLGFK